MDAACQDEMLQGIIDLIARLGSPNQPISVRSAFLAPVSLLRDSSPFVFFRFQAILMQHDVLEVVE